jgi:hypothetical protein
MVKPKWTSAEVAVIADRKAALRRRADKLKEKRKAKLDEMERQEELQEEVEERTTVVRKPSNLDNDGDVVMDPFISDANESGIFGDEDQVVEARQVAPKISRKQNPVCFF